MICHSASQDAFVCLQSYSSKTGNLKDLDSEQFLVSDKLYQFIKMQALIKFCVDDLAIAAAFFGMTCCDGH